jgi:glycine/serine hydroxymethyltransferase
MLTQVSVEVTTTDEIFNIIDREKQRQREGIELIAFEISEIIHLCTS